MKTKSVSFRKRLSRKYVYLQAFSTGSNLKFAKEFCAEDPNIEGQNLVQWRATRAKDYSSYLARSRSVIIALGELGP